MALIPISAFRRLDVAVRRLLPLAVVVAMTGPASAAMGDKLAKLNESLEKTLPIDGEAVVILATRDGKPVYQRASGLADRETARAVEMDTPFRIGSVSKQFTAAAILRLAEQGKLSVEDPLGKFFPDYPNGAKITLRHLLTHRSGLANYTSKPDFIGRVTRAVSPAEAIAWFRNDPPDFAPGEKFAYSNTNYFLLAEIVAKVSGRSFDQFLQEEFFAPLGLKSTGVFRNSDPPPGAAKGYSYDEGKFIPATDWDMSWAGGAGALYSTAGDLCLWTEALHGGRVLKPGSLQAMLAFPESSGDDEGISRYGFGLYHSEIGGLPVIGHSGGLHGFLSRVVWFPQQKLAITVLGNAMPPSPEAAPARILSQVARGVLGDEIREIASQLDPTIDPATYGQFVGCYDLAGGVQEITVENGRIFARYTGQKRFEVFPSGPDEFFFKVAEARMQFLRGSDGRVIALRHTQNDMTSRADRIEEKVAIPDAELESLTGKYQYGLLAVMNVTKDGRQLYAQLGGQSKVPIFAESKTKFVWRVVKAQIEFQRDDKGIVLGGTHTQNGVSFFAPKIVEPKP